MTPYFWLGQLRDKKIELFEYFIEKLYLHFEKLCTEFGQNIEIKQSILQRVWNYSMACHKEL